MEVLTKEFLVAEINRMDPSYAKLKIDLNKYTFAELENHYNRKKNAPVSSRRSSFSTAPTRQVTPRERSDGFEEVTPSSTSEDRNAKSVGVSFSGFDALKKG